MSNETDRLVSDTYNELADEKTPETLNRAVLRLAAKEGRTRYSIARAWMRPVAWAATIGLSLIVVLELTSLPESDMAPQSVPAAADPDVAERQAGSIKEEPALEAGQERKDTVAKRSRPYSPDQSNAEKIATRDVAPSVGGNAIQAEPAPRSADVLVNLEAEDIADAQETTERAQQRADQTSRLPVEVASAPEVTLDESSEDDPVRRAAAARSDALRTESFAAGTASLRAEPRYLCPVEARLSAEKWWECIEELEADLPAELVEREYEALRKSYPDFEFPAADK